MNLSLQDDESESADGLSYVNFNQDSTSLAVGTTSGYKFFSLKSMKSLDLIYEHSQVTDLEIPWLISERKMTDELFAVERLYSSGLVLSVNFSNQRRLFIFNFRKGVEVTTLHYQSAILSVKLNRTRIIVCLQDKLCIHSTGDLSLLHTISDMPLNIKGLFALSSNTENSYIAYPSSATVGDISIFDTTNLLYVTTISAHNGLLAALSFSPCGTKIATASEKGTVIRVFNAKDGTKLADFRRGLSRCATIYSLSFSPDSNLLCASSNTETVHIFKLTPPSKPKPTPPPQGLIQYGSSILWMAKEIFMPQQVSELFSLDRAFAIARLPISGIRNISSITVVENSLHILVASANGWLYIFDVNAEEGGECNLVRQHKFISVGSELEPSLLSNLKQSVEIKAEEVKLAEEKTEEEEVNCE